MRASVIPSPPRSATIRSPPGSSSTRKPPSPTRDMRVTAVISIRCPGSLRSHGIRPINRRRARAGSLLPVIRSALPRRTVYITTSMLSGRTKTRHSDIIPSGERSSSAQYIRAFASATLVSGTVIPPARFDRLSAPSPAMPLSSMPIFELLPKASVESNPIFSTVPPSASYRYSAAYTSRSRALGTYSIRSEEAFFALSVDLSSDDSHGRESLVS